MKGSYILPAFILLFSFSTLKGTNVVIIESESFNAGHVMDNNWLSVCTGLGYTAAIYPQTELDVNTWFSTTDVLIVSSGVISLPANRIATIQAFLLQGGRVYLQTEYLSSYTTNGAFQQIVNANGGNFAWGITYSGTLAPMVVSGSLSTTPNAISPLTYFWYGVNGTTTGCSSHIENFLTYEGVYFGFIFCVPTNNSRMITTCDQDWVNQLTSTALMQNIVINLASPTYTCVVNTGGLNVNIGNDTTLCNGQSAIFNATTTGATSYLWSNNATTPTITVSTAGTYSVQVSNGSCTAYDTMVVTTGTTPVVSISAPAALTCTAPSEVLTASSTTNGTTFNWGGGVTTAANTITAPGTYAVTATDPAGCTSNATANVTQNNTAPNASAASSGPLTCTNTTSLLTASSTTNGVTFNWGGGVTNATYAVLSPGGYTVTVTDPSNGCTNTATVNVTQSGALPNITVTPPVILTCTISSEVLTASSTTPGATFDWGGGVVSATNTVSSPGSYTVTATDPSNGCLNTATIAVTQSVSPPQVSIAAPAVLTCTTTSQVLSATSNVTGAAFVWSNGSTAATSAISSAGNYGVTATDPSNSCTAAASTTVTQDTASPDVTIAPPADLTCTNTTIQLTASSTVTGAAYNWGAVTTPSYSVSVTGNYTVTVTGPLNGCTASASATVNQNITPPGLTVSPPGSLTCNVSSVIITASSTSSDAVTYSWAGGGNTAANAVTTPGTYQVTATDAVNGCTSSASATVNSIAPPALTYSGINVSCYGGNNGSITSAPAGGVTPYTFLWSNGQTIQNLSALQAGNYALTITDSVGCTASISAILTEPQAIQLTADPTEVTCNGSNDGAIQITVAGGVSPLTYTWSDGADTSGITSLAAGTYSLTVTDNTSCTASVSVNISQPLPVTVTDVTTQISCFDATDGSVQLTVTGGTPSYSFLWSDGNTNPNRAGLAAGNYSVVVTDQHQCTASASFSLTAPAAIVILPALQEPTCPQIDNDGSISLTVSGGDSIFSYSWSTGSNSAGINNLAPGNYTVTVTDSHGCSAAGNYALSYLYDFTVTTLPSSTIDLGQSTTLNYTITGTTGNITSNIWSPATALSCSGCVSPAVSPDVTTTYQISVVNQAGCTVSDTVTVYVIPQYNIFVPNVFTPNGDGRNDYFQLSGNLQTLQYADIQIYDRWGEKVFESHDVFFQWDGTYKGVLQAPQVFAYELKMVFIDGHVVPLKKGCITLLR